MSVYSIEQLEFSGLTHCEAKVTDLVLDGYCNKKIGELLGTKEKTVKFHLTTIYKKCQVKSRAELIVKMLNQGPVEISTEPANITTENSRGHLN